LHCRLWLEARHSKGHRIAVPGRWAPRQSVG